MSIHSYLDAGLVVYFRKSPRHNWRIGGCALLSWTEAFRAFYLLRRDCQNDPAWSEHEIKTAWMDFPGGRVPDNLPRNYFKGG